MVNLSGNNGVPCWAIRRGLSTEVARLVFLFLLPDLLFLLSEDENSDRYSIYYWRNNHIDSPQNADFRPQKDGRLL
jgi:hypothetical protein